MLPLIAASLATPREPSAIINGQVAENCAWPSVVLVETEGGTVSCSGTLVHPYIIATASHCLVASGGSFARAVFGEGTGNNVLASEIEFCEINPEYPVDAATTDEFDNTDFAFCKLVTPVDDVPIIPIAYGCELDAVQAGVDVVAVGFGRTATATEDDGTKRFGTSVLTEIDAGELVNESITCYGDSGGPYFMQLPGGELRQIGIVSYGQTEVCSSASVATAASGLVPFVFETTGIDIAPCHDIDGTWAPEGSCGGVPLEPHVGGPGSYAEGCPTGELSLFEATCGPGIDATPDTTAPTVAIVMPESGTMVESDAMVSIEIEADDGDGWGVALVELVIELVDGPTDIEQRETKPYQWSATLPNGAYYLRGVAQDHAGNGAESEWVSLGVGVPAPPPREDEEETTGGASSSDDGSETTSPMATTSTTGEPAGETTDDTDAAAADEPTADSGCGCRSAPASAVPMLVLVLGAIRRRRSR